MTRRCDTSARSMAAPRNKSTYTKATFPVHAAMADEAAGFLIANGALGCAVAEMEKPGRRPREIVTLEAFFSKIAPRRIDSLRTAMRDAAMLARDARGGAPRKITDPGWATMWQERFKPFPIGKRFLIVPPWDQKKMPGRISLVIRPGLGFGTGHHPSTAGALRAIESVLAEQAPRVSALDVGTGSGVLAFAMASGGMHVVAIDVDRQALQNARENAALNPARSKIRFSSTPLEKVTERFDLVTANILSSVLIAMAPALVKRLKPRGRLILGGILATEVRHVLPAYRALRVIANQRSRGWATLVLGK